MGALPRCFPERADANAGNAAPGAKLLEPAQARRRFRYRRLHDLIRPEFPEVNHKKNYRFYRKAKLSVRQRKKTKFPGEAPAAAAGAVSELGDQHFVFDQLANGRRIQSLPVHLADPR